jgi:2',3'-cyclic-nucleotide 2'-phosphodiesterase (5'-nucleotidase family)
MDSGSPPKEVSVDTQATCVIVLAHMPYAEAISLFQSVGDVTVVIVAHDGDLVMTPQEVGGVLMVRAGKQGKAVGILQFVANTAGQIIEYRGQTGTLDERIDQDSEMQRLMTAHGFD